MKDHTWGTVAIVASGPIRRLRLTRPAERNAISGQMIDELRLALAALADDSDARVVVLEGEGKSFCAGADIEEMKASGGKTFDANLRDAERLAELFHALDTFPRPVIGRVHGHCLGGGVGLVACCDIAIASSDARFAFTEVRLGLAPAVISPYVIAAIGARQARKLFATGESFDAQRAFAIGLVHGVVAPDALDAGVEAVVVQLLQGGPAAQGEIKKLVAMVAREGGADDLEARTTDVIARLRASPEGKEGLDAFLGKREPGWRR